MSLLQTHLGGYPIGTFVSPSMLKLHKEMNRQLDAQRMGEIELAKQIQKIEGCSWGVALRAAIAINENQ